MARVSRTPVTILQPLNQRQIDYFFQNGAKAASESYGSLKVWWLQYFMQQNGSPLPLDAWEDPGFDIGVPKYFVDFRDETREEMNRARSSRSVLQRMQSYGTLPPLLNQRDPYRLPDYFDWWQSENAFRRGYMKVYEESFLDEFKKSLKTYVAQDGNILTRNAMERLTRDYKLDPVIAKFFNEMSDAVENGQPSPYSSLKALYVDLLRLRERSYEQFSPYFVPLRWAPGAGLVGIELE